MLRELLAVHVPLLDDGGLGASRGKEGPLGLAALEGGRLQSAPQDAPRGDRHCLHKISIVQASLQLWQLTASTDRLRFELVAC